MVREWPEGGENGLSQEGVGCGFAPCLRAVTSEAKKFINRSIKLPINQFLPLERSEG